MAKMIRTNLDFKQNQALGLVMEKATTAPSSPVSGQMYYNTSTNVMLYYNGTAWISILTVPTVSNVGTGIGVYKGVNGTTLEFRSITSSNAALTVTSANDEVKLSLVPANISHTTLGDIGTNTHAQIDAHIANTSNPHSTTKTQVGLGNVDNVQQIPMSYLDTDGTLTANSNTKVASQKAIKTYVESKLTGLTWKDKVRAATTTNGALATAYANGQTIDGVALATGDRILIKNQTTGVENGIYTVNASGAPTRASDADTGTELINATVFVSEGTNNADTAWTCTNNTITLGTTVITFVQFSGAGTYVAGTGLSLSGNTFSVSNLTTSHFASGVIGTSTSLGTSDTVLPTQNAVKVYVDGQVSTINTNINNRTKYYKGTISAATTGTITVATHGCGTLPQVQLYETISTVNYLVDADISVNASGDVTWTTSTSFTGFIVIIGK